MAAEYDVLVVGAGPTGLMMALWLARAGIKPLVIDRKETTSRESRALGVQGRTMETYDMLGLGARALTEGTPARGIAMWHHGRTVARARLTDMGGDTSPHPYMFVMGQDRTERMLLDALQAAGGEVRWNTGLVTLTQGAEETTAVLRRADGSEETLTARYVCGCDGASSPVRHALGIGFPGGTYSERFYVADVAAQGPLDRAEIGLCLDAGGFVAFFPMPGEGRYRIVGIVPKPIAHKADLGFEDVRQEAERLSGMTVGETYWFSTYNVHHRVADRFRSGRAFLLGDAGHIHSPVGGQGMNTGLMDATNLGWKLGAVLRGAADERILDTYEPERMPFARQLVETTDRVFTVVSSPNPLAGFLRAGVLPAFFNMMTHLPLLRHELYGLVSQTRINYRHSPLSKGEAGRVAGGDRLPWVHWPDGMSNFDALHLLQPHFQVYGDVPQALADYVAAHPNLPLRRFADTPEVRRTGLQPGAVYFLRPDGYVEYAAPTFSAPAFDAAVRAGWGVDPARLTVSWTAENR